MKTALVLFSAHWFLSLFCQSFFLHRYCSHGMFSMSRFWERFFYLLTYLTQGPSFLNPRCYSIMHQKHHMYSDTRDDPHSPKNFKSAWAMMVDTYRFYNKLILNKNYTEKGIYKYYPQWHFVDKLGESRFNVYLWIAVYLSLYIALNLPWYAYFVLPFHFFVGPLQGAIVNWCGHRYGSRNFNTHDDSRNTLPIDIPLMGELYQNNHHRFGKKMNFAYRWYELDLTFQLARLLNHFGIIRIKT